ncbi:MAG: hypothetical protein CM15mP125_0660 [Gammaproteobacteria bacterium]|nr:MAG: hypothetical protein CM15mP125_0660 [Gammaproteobacteria bacterium]
MRAAMEVVETKFPIEMFDVRQVKPNSRFLDLNKSTNGAALRREEASYH